MKVCYDALSDANNEEFQTKIKRGWKHFYNKNIRSLVSKYYFICLFYIKLLIILFFNRLNDYHDKQEVILYNVLRMQFMLNFRILQNPRLKTGKSRMMKKKSSRIPVSYENVMQN
jgi:hypothetical protein